MSISVSGQTMEFLYSALLGVGLGVLYDLFRVLRSYIKGGKKVVTAVSDVLFWIIAICALIGFVLTVSGGAMRWYVLVGVFCGSFVYLCTISTLFFKSIRIIIRVLIRSLGMLSKPLYWIAGGVLRLGRRVEKKIKNRPPKKKKPRKEKKRKQEKQKKQDGGTDA